MRTYILILIDLFCCSFISAHPADSLKATKNMLHVSSFLLYGTIHYNDKTFIVENAEFLKNESDIWGGEVGYGINFSKQIYNNWFLSIPILYRDDLELFWLKYKFEDSETTEYSIFINSQYINLGMNVSKKFQLYKTPLRNSGLNLYPFAGFNFRYLIDKEAGGLAFYSNSFVIRELEQIPLDEEGRLFCDPLAGLIFEIKVNELLIQPKFHIQKDNRHRIPSRDTKAKCYSTVWSLAIGF